MGITAISLFIVSCLDSPMGWEKEDYRARSDYIVLGLKTADTTTIAPPSAEYAAATSLDVLLCGTPSGARRNVILSRVFYSDDTSTTSTRVETLATSLDSTAHALHEHCPNDSGSTYSTNIALLASKVSGISRLRVRLQGVKNVERELQILHKKTEEMPVATGLRVESESFGLPASWSEAIGVSVQLLDSVGNPAAAKSLFVDFVAIQDADTVGGFYHAGEQAAKTLRLATDGTGAINVLFSAGDADAGPVQIVATARLSQADRSDTLSIVVE